MKKKEKKQKKKIKKGKDKLKHGASVTDDAAVQTLTDKIKKLKAELKQRDELIGSLLKRLKKPQGANEESTKKNKKPKAKGATKLLRSQRRTRIGVAQKEAWKKHGLLRDRYEYHLENGEEKGMARTMANRDLIDAFGDESGYSEQELEVILS